LRLTTHAALITRVSHSPCVVVLVVVVKELTVIVVHVVSK